MFFLLSPAKNLDEKTAIPLPSHTVYSNPRFIEQAAQLMQTLKNYDVIDLQELMGVSAKIAELNVIRNQHWAYPFDENAKPAIYLLYGLLKPLDLILPYRLEMGTKFQTKQADNLYQFWGNKITDQINQHLKQSDGILVNLASQEYFGAVHPKQIQGRIITPRFEDAKNDGYKVVSFYAKKARGLMVNYAAKHQIQDVEDLKYFDTDGYYFAPSVSDENHWVFRREW